MDAHHVGQKALMKELVENYDPKVAPAINVPKVGHTISAPMELYLEALRGLQARDNYWQEICSN